MRSNKSGLLAGRLVSQGTFRPLFNKHRSAYNGVLAAYGPAHLAAPEGMDVVTERARGSVSPSHFWEPAPINAPGRISPINFSWKPGKVGYASCEGVCAARQSWALRLSGATG